MYTPFEKILQLYKNADQRAKPKIIDVGEFKSEISDDTVKQIEKSVIS